jgi:DNA replication protein DnaC
MQESVFNIIDTRYRAGKPMIITTNMTLAELDGATDLKRKRYHQRIMEKCLPVKVDHNKRTEKMFETIMDMRKRMGIDE